MMTGLKKIRISRKHNITKNTLLIEKDSTRCSKSPNEMFHESSDNKYGMKHLGCHDGLIIRRF